MNIKAGDGVRVLRNIHRVSTEARAYALYAAAGDIGTVSEVFAIRQHKLGRGRLVWHAKVVMLPTAREPRKAGERRTTKTFRLTSLERL